MISLRNLYSIFFIFPLLFSCSFKSAKAGRVEFDNVDKSSFIFFVNQKANYSESKKDELHPQLTEGEAKLLNQILKQSKRCFNKEKELSFQIISRQEKIYDVTYAGLIENNYNPRSVTPIMYFGRCI